jgi:hypothetical protein
MSKTTFDDFDFIDNYDFMRLNYYNSWRLMFEQEIYQYRAEFKDYLKFFLRFKQTEPLTTLANYLDGRKDLAIQTIELEDCINIF